MIQAAHGAVAVSDRKRGMDLVVRDLEKVYAARAGEHVVALKDVSTEIRSGEFVTLVGPSGCGKSTLLDILAGLTPKTDGVVTIGGREVTGGHPSDQVSLGFQKPVLLPWKTAVENVYMPANLGEDPPARKRGPELRGRAEELLDLFLASWEALTASGLIADYLLPRASDVLVVLWQNILEIITGGPMRGHFIATLIEIILGFFGSVVIGVAVGAVLAELKLVQRAILPYVVAANATPRIAFAPLFVIWFGFDHPSKIVMAIAIAAFPVIVNTMAGLAATDRDALRLMRSLGGTRTHILWQLRIPTALPYLFAGFETAMLFSAVGAVIGEFMGGSQGLGYVTLLAQELFRLDDAFAAIVLLSIQGFVLHRLVVIARRKLVFWQADQDAPTPR